MEQLIALVQTFALAQSHVSDPKLALETQQILTLLQACETQTKRMVQNIQNAVSQSEGEADAKTDWWHLSAEQIVCMKGYLAAVNADK